MLSNWHPIDCKHEYQEKQSEVIVQSPITQSTVEWLTIFPFHEFSSTLRAFIELICCIWSVYVSFELSINLTSVCVLLWLAQMVKWLPWSSVGLGFNPPAPGSIFFQMQSFLSEKLIQVSFIASCYSRVNDKCPIHSLTNLLSHRRSCRYSTVLHKKGVKVHIVRIWNYNVSMLQNNNRGYKRRCSRGLQINFVHLWFFNIQSRHKHSHILPPLECNCGSQKQNSYNLLGSSTTLRIKHV